MKHIFLFLLFFCFINISTSQCPSEAIVLLTQTDVDNFAQQYPNCTYLETNLYIGTNTHFLSSPNCDDTTDPIINLSGLDQLTYIRDSLVIQCNNSLKIIDGFNALDSVGSIFISDNEQLTDILGFGNLKSSAQIIRVRRNDIINTIAGFNSLKSARSVVITANALVDLSKLEYCFALNLTGDIEMLHMDSIRELLNLGISSNNISSNFDFLSGSELEIPNFSIRDISIPFSFRGLELLTKTKLGISNVNDVDFSQLESLSEMRSFHLSNCENCTSLSGLEDIYLTFSLRVTGNPLLTTLDGFSGALGEISILRIFDCEKLENIDAISSISSSITVLEISNNPSLDNCSIKPICRALSTDLNVLTIENNGPSNTCNTSDQILMDCLDKETYLDFTTCEGDTITLNNVDYTSVGLFYQDFIDQQGLDSILVIDITASDDCTDPNDDPDLCPLDEEKPGLQINKLSDNRFDIIITYKESNMSLYDIDHASIIEIIECHKVCRDLTFDVNTFSFIDHCDMVDDLSRGSYYDIPDASNFDAFVYFTALGEMSYFSEFISQMAIEECVKM